MTSEQEIKENEETVRQYRQDKLAFCEQGIDELKEFVERKIRDMDIFDIERATHLEACYQNSAYSGILEGVLNKIDELKDY